MNHLPHWAIFTTNASSKKTCIKRLMSKEPPSGFEALKGAKIALFSKLILAQFIEEEARHHIKKMHTQRQQAIRSLSSGEQKKALLQHLLKDHPTFLILDNPFDSLDTATQVRLKEKLQDLASKLSIIQFVSRKTDCLPFITTYYRLDKNELALQTDTATMDILGTAKPIHFDQPIPSPLKKYPIDSPILVALKAVSVQYGNYTVLHNINWTIRPGEFWQLVGANGSGKTTLLSMITGENSKGYGQELYLFGRKKGSGESIWEIKEKIGYVTASMTARFLGYHSLEHMLISGLYDSIGLYVQPTAAARKLAKKWLQLLQMEHLKHAYFHELTRGQQRMLMLARAVIKHPLLLILDEPTVDLDDTSAAVFVRLVNKIAEESKTTILYVSHRNEPGLHPKSTYVLRPSEKGSIGSIL